MPDPCPRRPSDRLDDACPTCGHIIIAHRKTDSVCSVCEAVERITADADDDD